MLMGKDLTIVNVCVTFFVKMYDQRSLDVSTLIEWDIFANIW